MSLITCGDCLHELPKLKDNSIDLLVTDPPYGYSFMGKDWDKAVPSVQIWKECLEVLKPGAFAFIMSSPRQDVLAQMIVRLQDAGFETNFTSLYWCYASGFPKAANVGKLVDKKLGVERKVIGIKPTKNQVNIKGGNFTVTDGNPVMENLPITAPATPAAKRLDGSYAGYQPKPAVEVILVAMKPLSEKTYVDQALSNQKGVTWLDDTRIPYQSNDDMNDVNGYKLGGKFECWDKMRVEQGYRKPSTLKRYETETQPTFEANEKGRFPANLLVSDNILGESFSRYFSLDAWAEKTLPFMIVAKASKSEKGIDNNHPTVKPSKLMSYLVTMGSRPNDIVLDPFAGSGTTGIAALQLGRQFIGIELSKEYCKIAENRLKPYLEQTRLTTVL